MVDDETPPHALAARACARFGLPDRNGAIFGFVVGSAGKELEVLAVSSLLNSSCEVVRDGPAEGLGEEDLEGEATHAADLPALPAPGRPLLDEGIAGKEEPQLPCLLTGERDDCAVELFSFKTREPPPPSVVVAVLAGTPLGPLGPGNEG